VERRVSVRRDADEKNGAVVFLGTERRDSGDQSIKMAGSAREAFSRSNCSRRWPRLGRQAAGS